MTDKTHKRILRWESEFVKAKVQLSRVMAQPNQKDVLQLKQDAIDKIMYCEGKLIDVLVHAMKTGEMTQNEVDQQIFEIYPRIVDQWKAELAKENL